MKSLTLDSRDFAASIASKMNLASGVAASMEGIGRDLDSLDSEMAREMVA
jgi:hypothetical protein